MPAKRHDLSVVETVPRPSHLGEKPRIPCYRVPPLGLELFGMHLESLINAEYLDLSTFRKSGVEVSTPVWAAFLDDSFYIFTEADSGKVKRLRNSPRARLATCTADGKVTGARFDAEAYIVEDSQEISRAYRALHEKYGWKMKLTDTLSKLARKYDKRAILKVEVIPERVR